MEGGRLTEVLKALSAEQQLLCDLEIKVSQLKQRVSCHDKQLLDMDQEKAQVTSGLSEMEALEIDLTLNVLPQMEKEVEMAKASRSHMEMTMKAVRSKKKELSEQLASQTEVHKKLLTERSASFRDMMQIHEQYI